MEVKKAIKTKDGFLVFKGKLTPEEHEFALAVGLSTLMEQGAIAMTQGGEEEEMLDLFPPSSEAVN